MRIVDHILGMELRGGGGTLKCLENWGKEEGRLGVYYSSIARAPGYMIIDYQNWILIPT